MGGISRGDVTNRWMNFYGFDFHVFKKVIPFFAIIVLLLLPPYFYLAFLIVEKNPDFIIVKIIGGILTFLYIHLLLKYGFETNKTESDTTNDEYVKKHGTEKNQKIREVMPK